MPKLLGHLREYVRHQELVLVSLVVAYLIVSTPLQHHITLARYQHYSLGMFALAAGYLLQAVVSWRAVSIWGKLTLLGSSSFIASVAHFFYRNPWLDNADLATMTQIQEQHRFALSLLICALPLTFVWLRWNIELYKEHKAKLAAERKLVRS